MNEINALDMLRKCVRNSSINLVPFDKIEKEFHGLGSAWRSFSIGSVTISKTVSFCAGIGSRDRLVVDVPYPKNMSAWVAEQLGYPPATSHYEHVDAVTISISRRIDEYALSGYWMDYSTYPEGSWEFPDLKAAWDWLLKVIA